MNARAMAQQPIVAPKPAGGGSPPPRQRSRALQRSAGHDFSRVRASVPLLQRQDLVDVELAPTPPEEVERLRQQGVDLPQVSAETWEQLTNHASQALTQPERTKIMQVTQTQPETGPPAGSTQGPKFVLHDTQGAFGASEIGRRAGLARGPLGEEGSAAYVPASGPAVNSYGLFEPRRVASTQYERGQDIMVKADREKQYRAVWLATNAAEQTAALTRALAALSLKPHEITKETTNARKQLNAKSGEVRTTASWAIAEICSAASGNVAAVAETGQEAALTTACAALAKVLAARRERLGTTTNVEIVQEAGSGCSTKGGAKKLPPYTATHYSNTMLVYLRAALAANHFPEVTTHWVIDRKIGDHCDPRCFNLTRFYELIRTTVGHYAPARYGVEAVYGTAAPATVWWHDPVCGGAHP